MVERLKAALEWAREQPWYPERKVIHGAIVGALSAAAAYVLLDVNDPILLAVITGVADKVTEYLVPASAQDTARQRRRNLRRQRID